MNITDYIQNKINPLNLKSSVKTAKKLFDNYAITHFVVVENTKILGCFAQDDLLQIESESDELVGYSHLLNSFFADKEASVLELLKIFADNDTTLIPVINAEKEYLGYYNLSDVLEVFSMSPFMTDNSETLIIEKTKNDYSMSEVSQIVESNNGKLLGVYVSGNQGDLVQITLKISTEDIHEIMQTFRRYDYKIISIHENDIYLEDLKNRSDYLQKYLEM
jgi:predicted transcriptional regulator